VTRFIYQWFIANKIIVVYVVATLLSSGFVSIFFAEV